MAVNITTTTRAIKLSKTQTQLLSIRPIFSHKYNSRPLSSSFTFITCTLKTSKDKNKNNNNNNKSLSAKIVISEKAPLLSEPAQETTNNAEAPDKPRRTTAAGGFGFLKRLPRKLLSILSNLPLAIGEMFAIAGLMALGIYIFLSFLTWNRFTANLILVLHDDSSSCIGNLHLNDSLNIYMLFL